MRARTVTLLVAFAAAGYSAAAAEPKDAGSAGERAVTVLPAKQTCFDDTLQVTGILVAREEILVQPEREGLQISQILVQPGETVVSGQVLARLTPPEGQPGGSVAVQAPAAGVISAVSAAIGATATSRGLPLFRIARRGELDLLAEAPLKYLLRLANGQNAKTEIIGAGEFSGNVRQFSTTINPATQLGQVRISVGSDVRLHVGAFGRAIINLGRQCGPSVPLSAVLYTRGGPVVQIVRDNRVETRAVTVGLISGGQAEIREGVNEGEAVIARAGAFFRDGDQVRATTATPSDR